MTMTVSPPRLTLDESELIELTDKEKRDGMGAARDMGAHATDSQTADYVRKKSARKTGATK